MYIWYIYTICIYTYSIVYIYTYVQCDNGSLPYGGEMVEKSITDTLPYSGITADYR